MTLGSLFDGSGGFPLAGLMNGITPVWTSEIEPFPIRVTTKRMPFVKHYGDVSQISGADIEPVDIITFGSPCQDLSVAGKREGLDGGRSGLFRQAIRIIKEMRKKTNGMYPTYAIFENVPGVLSSGRERGEDFRIVLESFCQIIDSNADVPRPEKWSNAGEILGDGYSIAWRILDAQYWGVPQRRRRIFLVADLAGQRAGKILFESEGLSGYFAQGGNAREETAGNAEESAGAVVDTPKTLKIRSGREGGGKGALVQDNKSATLGCHNDQTLFVPKVYGVCYKESNAMKSDNPNSGFYEAETSRTLDGNGGNPSCNQGGMAVVCVDMGGGKSSVGISEERAPTVSEEPYYIVRRLTPTECARLQGFPDWWCSRLGTDDPSTDDLEFWRDVFETHRKATGSSSKPKSDAQIIKWLKDPHSDSAEYKLWGNGVALPCVDFVLRSIIGGGYEK